MTATLAKGTKKLKPLNDKLIVEKIEAKEQTEGGIYLPSGAQEKPLEGRVLAAGPGAIGEKGERQPMQVKEGDKVIYSKYSGTEIKCSGKELLIISEKDILAIVQD